MNRPTRLICVLFLLSLLFCFSCEESCDCAEDDNCMDDEDGDSLDDDDDDDDISGEDGDDEAEASDGDEDLEDDDEEAQGELIDLQFQRDEQFVIYDGNGTHLAFPDVTRLENGKLMIVFRQGNSHVDSTGKIMKLFGEADGLTWQEEPFVLTDVSGMDDRDPSVATLSNGRVLVNYFQYKTHSFTEGSVSLHHIFTTQSENNAASFGSLIQVDPGEMSPTEASLNDQGLWTDGNDEPFIIMASSSSVVEMENRWLLPAYGANALNLSALASMPRSRISLYESTDNGQHWTEQPVMHDEASDVWLMEPALLRLKDGRLLLHVRTAEGNSPSNPGPLKQSISDDNGQSWSSWSDFPFIAHAPELLQVENGAILSAFRWLNDAYSAEDVSFVVSLDGARSWSERIVIEDCGAAECGYPGLLQLDDGRLLVVYYSPGGRQIKAAIYSMTPVYENAD